MSSFLFSLPIVILKEQDASCELNPIFVRAKLGSALPLLQALPLETHIWCKSNWMSSCTAE